MASHTAGGVAPLTLRVHRLDRRAALPRYGRLGDAGLDLFSLEAHLLGPGERHVFGTGVAVAIPEGFVGLVWDRSGLASRHGLTTLGGVIDATYRGEVRVPLLNTGSEPYHVAMGDRIAQLLVQAIPVIEIQETQELDHTGRGDAGFGSSGR